MKTIILGFALAFGLAAPAMADPVEGIWQTEVDDGAYAHVEMYQCGPKICGKIARTFNASGEYKSPNIGRQLVIGMKGDGSGSYKGQVWRPSNNKIYIGKMSLAGDRVKLKGCVAGGLICSSQNWVRVK